MATEIMAGKDGSFKFDSNQVAYIDSFSLSLNRGTAEVSQLGNDFKEYIATVGDWSGSASGTLDLGDAGQEELLEKILSSSNTVATAEFKVNKSSKITGEVIITSASITASHGDQVSVSYNFQGNKAPTKGTAT